MNFYVNTIVPSAFTSWKGINHPKEITANFIYIRLHGPCAKYQGSYSDLTLKAWGDQCLQWQALGKDIYVYFDNDQKGYAAFNANKLKEIITTFFNRQKP